MSIVLEARKLTRTFGSGRTLVRAVDDVSLQVRAGELVMIAGPSGSGKTTLVSMLGCLLTPSAGEVRIEGEAVSFTDRRRLAALRASKIGFVFQAFNLLDPLTVTENIVLPAAIASRDRHSAVRLATLLMARLGLEARATALPRTLSGGEKQRVAIARALINRPPVIIADEPTGNLDAHNGQEVMMILHDVARDEGCAVVLVTHDPRVEEIADRILWLADGKLHDRDARGHVWTRDPVCRMRVDERTAVHVHQHLSRRFTFCSRRCLDRFVADPARYGVVDAGA
jgi:putative ABC transport system ATP-binding protein